MTNLVYAHIEEKLAKKRDEKGGITKFFTYTCFLSIQTINFFSRFHFVHCY